MLRVHVDMTITDYHRVKIRGWVGKHYLKYGFQGTVYILTEVCGIQIKLATNSMEQSPS